MTRTEWMNVGYANGIITENIVTGISFSEMYKRWFLMKMNIIKPQSLDRIEVTYNKYVDTACFSTLDVGLITETHIVDYLTMQIVGYGNMTYKEFARIWQIVHGVLCYGRDTGISIPLYDWDAVKRKVPIHCIDVGKRKEFCIPEQDITKLYTAVLQDKIYPLKQSACICLLMNFQLGLRVGELACLTWSDIDYMHNVIHVHKTETKSFERDADGTRSTMLYTVDNATKTISGIRDVPMTQECMRLLALLREHHAGRGYTSPYLCYDGTDTILVRSLDRTLRRLCRICSIDCINSHRIRKTFASMLHGSNVPTRIISDLLGHSDVSTTERYYVISNRDKLEETRKLMECALKNPLKQRVKSK